MQTASEMNWKEISPHLGRHEYPGDVLEHMNPRIIRIQSRLRDTVGRPLYPSPVAGAHVRHRARSPGAFDGDRHATDNGNRLSDATDFFCAWEDAEAYMVAAAKDDEIGGIGIYDAMKFRGPAGTYCMMHIDGRPGRVLWVGHGRDPVEYVMQHNDRERYTRLLLEAIYGER